MPASGPLAGAILAGGAARRLGGRAKALMRLHGRSILERQLAVLRGLAHPIVIVANDPAPYAGFELAVVPDDVPGAGPLGGIYTALRHAPSERVLVVACDMPFLSRPLLEHMARLDGDVVVARSARGVEPLCAIYRRARAVAIGDRIARGDLAASEFPAEWNVEEVGAETVAVLDPHGLMFVNVNTPHDYARACELGDPSSKAAQDRIMDAR